MLENYLTLFIQLSFIFLFLLTLFVSYTYARTLTREPSQTLVVSVDHLKVMQSFQAHEFFLYGALMILDMGLLAFIAHKYTQANEKQEDKKALLRKSSEGVTMTVFCIFFSF